MLASLLVVVLVSGPSSAPAPLRFSDPNRLERGRWSDIQHDENGRLVTLDPVAFYRLVGRDDLVQRFRARQAKKLGLVIGGPIAAGIGSLLIGIGAGQADACGRVSVYRGSDPDLAVESSRAVVNNVHCRQSAGGVVAVGVLVAAAGSVITIVGAAMNAQPISATEAASLMETYNTRRAATTMPRLDLRLNASTTGASVALAGSF